MGCIFIMNHLRYAILPLLLISMLLMSSCSIIGRLVGDIDYLPEGEYVGSYESPDGRYTINIFLFNGGATVDYCIRGELIENTDEADVKKNIYWNYHEETAKVEWESDTVVVINGHRLDVSEKETYDWRHN